jgi:hypothetical protein
VGTPGRLLATPGRAASVVSNVTDTPAKKKARANLISRNLPRLFTAAEDLFNALGSPQEELEAWEDERTFYKKLLDVVRSSFVASASDLVVVPSFVTEAMGVDQNSPLFYKALRIVTATNLATLLNDITPVNAQSLLPLLQVLDKAFFECFVADIPITAENQIYEQILEQAIMIRTQLSIQTLKKLRTDSPVSFSPHAELAKIWCEGEPSVDAIKLFLANNPDAVQIRPIEPDTPSAARADEWDRASTRFRALCGLVPGDVINGYNLDLTQLEEEFSLDGFIASLRAWTNQTFARIKRQLLESEAAPSDADSQIRSQLETESLMHGYNREASRYVPFPSYYQPWRKLVPNSFPFPSPITYDMNALRMMKQLESNATPNYSNPQLAASSYNPPPRVPYPPDFTTGFDYSDPSQHGFQSSGALYAASAAQIAAGKKRKDGAPADDGAPGSSAPPAKKPRARRNRNIAPVADMTALVSEPSNAAIPSETAPTESQYPPLLGPQDEPDFEALTKKSREVSAANRKAKEPQVRSPWVQKDVRLLVKAVDTYRCKWSQIEKAIKEGIIPFERPRDQQALRDKARLLKQDLLKYVPLHEPHVSRAWSQVTCADMLSRIIGLMLFSLAVSMVLFSAGKRGRLSWPWARIPTGRKLISTREDDLSTRSGAVRTNSLREPLPLPMLRFLLLRFPLLRQPRKPRSSLRRRRLCLSRLLLE